MKSTNSFAEQTGFVPTKQLRNFSIANWLPQTSGNSPSRLNEPSSLTMEAIRSAITSINNGQMPRVLKIAEYSVTNAVSCG